MKSQTLIVIVGSEGRMLVVMCEEKSPGERNGRIPLTGHPQDFIIFSWHLGEIAIFFWGKNREVCD